MPRPTKLTAAVRKTICDAVREGSSFEGACEAAGVAVSTGHEWFARGMGRDPRGRPAAASFAEFAEALTRARAEAELREVKQIVAASKDDWRAAAWLLERR